MRREDRREIWHKKNKDTRMKQDKTEKKWMEGDEKELKMKERTQRQWGMQNVRTSGQNPWK